MQEIFLAENHYIFLFSLYVLPDSDQHVPNPKRKKVKNHELSLDLGQLITVLFCVKIRARRLSQPIYFYLSVPDDLGSMAPMYFQKAIQECEYEWSDNKKLIKLKGGLYIFFLNLFRPKGGGGSGQWMNIEK